MRTSRIHPRRFLAAAVACAALCFTSNASAQLGKKGFPLATEGNDTTAASSQKLANINAAWYYNYGYTSPLHMDTSQSSPEFVPMILSIYDFSNDPVPSPANLPAHILGYNEPDHKPSTSGCSTYVFSPQLGGQYWPNVNNRVANGNSVGPASSYNGHPECDPWYTGSWFQTFHDYLTTNGIPHPKDIALHIYTCNLSVFEQYMNDAHANYPDNTFWVTEFACETMGEATTNPTDPSKHPSQAAVYSFIQGAVQFMEAQSWIGRYAWHDPRQGTSSIFLQNSTSLTCTGQKYAQPSQTPGGSCAP